MSLSHSYAARRAAPLSLLLLLSGAILGVLAVSLAVPEAHAQNSFGRFEETNSTVAYFYHGRPGEATMQVSVWGTVPAPGIYEVPATTNVDRLITMAGGTPAQVQQENREYHFTIRIFRERGGERAKIYEASVEELLRNTADYPALQDEDVMVVETDVDMSFSWRDGLSLLTTVGSLVVIAERLFFQ